MKNIIDFLKCSFGFHDYEFRIWTSRYGMTIGHRCTRCGFWSEKNKICIPKNFGEYEN